MNDDDLDFSPPAPRRERKEFEPPPWEQDRFDELAKRQKQFDAAPKQEDEGEDVPGPLEPARTEQQVNEEQEGAVGGPVSEKRPLDEKLVAAMLIELKADEPSVSRGFDRAGLVAGVLLLAIGGLLMIWAVVMITVAVRRSQQVGTGVLIGTVVLVFGVGFAGTGAWFVFRFLRQQGVL